MTAALGLAPADLQTIVEDTFGSMLADVPVAVDDVVFHDEVVSARIDIEGTWNGAVLVETSRPGAVAITAALLALPHHRVESLDLEDAVGELANIVGGSVKSCLDGIASLSLPRVTRLSPASIRPADTPLVLTALWNDHPLRVMVFRSAPSPSGGSA